MQIFMRAREKESHFSWRNEIGSHAGKEKGTTIRYSSSGGGGGVWNGVAQIGVIDWGSVDSFGLEDYLGCWSRRK
jgi:hypothetical protein